MFQELASGIGGAVIILGILALVGWIFRNHQENYEHKKAMEEHDRKVREEFPTVFRSTEQP